MLKKGIHLMKIKSKYLKVVALLGLVAIFLSACASRTTSGAMHAPTSGPYAWIYNLFGHPLQNIMLFVEAKIGGPNGAGWAIVLITLVVQFIVLPLRLNQSYKMTKQQERTKRLQPQINLVQQALKNNNLTQDQKMQVSQLQMKIYRENNLSLTGGIGCLPLLIQLPIMAGIYQAVAYSDKLAQTSFYGISLGQRSIALAIIATILYVIQAYLSMIGLSPEQKKTMQTTAFISPLITFFFAITYSGALALYFAAGGVVMVIQQLITTFILMPKVKKEVDKELKEKPIKEVVTEQTIADIVGGNTPNGNDVAATFSNQALHNDLRARNAGKQKRKDKDKN